MININIFCLQIENVVDKLKERGERILVLIPQCYTGKVIPNSAMAKGQRATTALLDDDKVIK